MDADPRATVPPGPVGLADIEQAAAVLAGVIAPSPLEETRWLGRLVGGPAYFKCENLQRAGSFKVRGAYTRMSRLSPAERDFGVVTASAGNHAQGVAVAAQLLGIRATVFMPEGAPLPKERATREYGADVVIGGESIDECLVAAAAFAEKTAATLIHPYDHVDIVAGQGSVGLEILQQCPDVATVVVAIGGGGLCAGILTVLREKVTDRHVRVTGVQAGGAASLAPSIEAGRPVQLPTKATMADGIAVGKPGAVPFAVLTDPARGLDDLRTVTEEQLSEALLSMLERAKMVVEPAGAASVAAVLADPAAFPPPLVMVLSGGNIDPLLLQRVIQHGLVSAGRYLSLTVRFPDRPGSLAKLLAGVAGSGANVLEVLHRRTSSGLAVDDVEVSVDLETRGAEHSDQVLDGLRRSGYVVRRNRDETGAAVRHRPAEATKHPG